MITVSDEYDHVLFNFFCQKIVSKVICFIRETCVASDQSRFSNFWCQLYNCIDKENMSESNNLPSELPKNIKDDETGLRIVFVMIVNLVQD